jgi:hypothetical protein
MPMLEADSQREVELQIQHLGLNPDSITDCTRDQGKGTGEVMRATTLKSLLFHVKIDSIADCYDIPELRSCSRTKVKNILNTSWSPHDFPIVIREVFNPTGDEELHDIFSEAMIAHIDELMGLGGVRGDITPPEVLSDFANIVLRKVAAATISWENKFVQRIGPRIPAGRGKTTGSAWDADNKRGDEVYRERHRAFPTTA